MATEMIRNGGFESGLTYWQDDFPDNLGFAHNGFWSISSFAHSGIKSAKGDAPRQYLAQDFSSRFTFNMITLFKVWQYETGPITRMYLIFQDGTYVYWNVCGGGGVGCSSHTWNELSGIRVWTGQPAGTYEDKIIVKIVLVCHWIGAGEVYMDDISIMADAFGEDDIIIDDEVGNIVACKAIEWRERQNCRVAIRNVPLRTTGSFVDTGTWTLRNRRLYITIRLTDADKTTLQTIFDGHIEVTITAGDWTYTGWFVIKPLVYEYSKNEDGDEREWIVEMEFALSSFSYSP